jgi:hypothetical protein
VDSSVSTHATIQTFQGAARVLALWGQGNTQRTLKGKVGRRGIALEKEKFVNLNEHPKSSLLLLLFALACIAIPAFAAQPQTFTDTETQTFTAPCSYGNLNFTTTFTAQGSIFLEPTDAATRLHVVFSASTVITNPLNGKTATGQRHSTQTLYQKNGYFVSSGLNQSIIVPGVGVVLQLAGRAVVDSSGNVIFSTPLLSNMDLTPLCNALQ